MRSERLEQAYEYLRSRGCVHTQAGAAEAMGASAATFSRALKGDEKSLTDKFLKRFNTAFGDVFNTDWLLTGDGEMLCPTPQQAPSPPTAAESMIDIAASLIKEVETLRHTLEAEIAETHRLNEELRQMMKNFPQNFR